MVLIGCGMSGMTVTALTFVTDVIGNDKVVSCCCCHVVVFFFSKFNVSYTREC